MCQESVIERTRDVTCSVWSLCSSKLRAKYWFNHFLRTKEMARVLLRGPWHGACLRLALDFVPGDFGTILAIVQPHCTLPVPIRGVGIKRDTVGAQCLTVQVYSVKVEPNVFAIPPSLDFVSHRFGPRFQS
jgi:hypothetical protein